MLTKMSIKEIYILKKRKEIEDQEMCNKRDLDKCIILNLCNAVMIIKKIFCTVFLLI